MVVRRGGVEAWVFARNRVVRKERKDLNLAEYDRWRSHNIWVFARGWGFVGARVVKRGCDGLGLIDFGR